MKAKQIDYKHGTYAYTEYTFGNGQTFTESEHKRNCGVGWFNSLPSEKKAILTEIEIDVEYERAIQSKLGRFIDFYELDELDEADKR